MMKRWLFVSVFSLAVLCLVPSPSQAKKEPIALQLAKAAGLDAWSKVKRVRFTWTVVPRKLSRSYDWDVPGKKVKVMANKKVYQLDLNDPKQRKTFAYKAFINDSYWPFFMLHLAWDTGVTIKELPVGGKLMPGATRQISVVYGDVGPSPKDTYIIHFNKKLRDVAWIFKKKSQKKANFVLTRERHITQKGVTIATLFKTPKGKVRISVDKVKIE